MGLNWWFAGQGLNREFPGLIQGVHEYASNSSDLGSFMILGYYHNQIQYPDKVCIMIS